MSIDKLTPDAVAARLRGLTSITDALKQRYNADDAKAVDMLHGSVEALADLRRLWPDEEDAGLIERAREMLQSRSAIDLLYMALAAAERTIDEAEMPFAR